MNFVEWRQGGACGRMGRAGVGKRDLRGSPTTRAGSPPPPAKGLSPTRALPPTAAAWEVITADLLALTLEDLLAAPVTPHLDRAGHINERARFEGNLALLRRLRPALPDVESVLHILERRLSGWDPALAADIDQLRSELNRA